MPSYIRKRCPKLGVANGKVFVRSGAGIVADSVPENEFEECINKAKAVMNALKEAEGGIDNDITCR